MNSSIDFHPKTDLNQLSEFVEFIEIHSLVPSSKRLEFYINSGQTLNIQQIGKMLVLSGKLWNYGYQVVFHCPKTVFAQLYDYGLQRIVWIESE